MRDPKRIKKMLNELADIWENKVPDWRMGQLLMNVFGSEDIFYMEDEKFMKRIKEYFNWLEK